MFDWLFILLLAQPPPDPNSQYLGGLPLGAEPGAVMWVDLPEWPPGCLASVWRIGEAPHVIWKGGMVSTPQLLSHPQPVYTNKEVTVPRKSKTAKLRAQEEAREQKLKKAKAAKDPFMMTREVQHDIGKLPPRKVDDFLREKIRAMAKVGCNASDPFFAARMEAYCRHNQVDTSKLILAAGEKKQFA